MSIPILPSYDCLTLLIDTGADISICKAKAIPKELPIDNSVINEIRGISEHSLTTRGTTNVQFTFPTSNISHKFHIVDNNFPIPADAILGRDFLSKFSCTLDYATWTLTIKSNEEYISLPILQSPTVDVIYIPPRCEIFRKIHSLTQLKEDSVITNREISPGVFVARSIVSKDFPFIQILNTNSKVVTIKNIKLDVTPVNDYNVFDVIDGNINRSHELTSQLNTSDIPGHVKDETINLCKEFSDIFAWDKVLLTANNFYEQNLKVADDKPVYCKNYRTPQAQKAEINKQVTEMLVNGIIEPSTSNYNSPLLLVPKKQPDGQKSWRLVVDFRQLNKKLISDKFPLPRIDDILDQLGRAKWFSIIDLFSGFHQIPLDEQSRDYTSFSTDSGSFRFTRLPFGLSVAPNSFMRMMSIAFAGVTPERAFLYMDDLIVIGCSEKHHLCNLRKVFETCRKYNLKLNPKKSQFFRKEVTFLGHKVTDKGILPDDSKYDMVKNFPRPESADQVKRFVAFCNYYRRFIPDFANISRPLNLLTRKNSSFVWSIECQNAFDNLKNSLVNPPILQYPDYSKPFILSTDASDLACGAVLSQNFDGIELPVAYASKSFTKGESHKATILKELTAIHWAIKHFRCYLYGTKFLVRTDHRPLVYLFTMKDPSSKLTRMRLDLEEYSFDIEYVKGKDNVGPDALSRISLNELKGMQEEKDTILAITRSKTRLLNKNAESGMVVNSKSTPEPRVYETLDNMSILRFANLKFDFKPNNNIIEIFISLSSAHRNLKVTNGEPFLDEVLSQLDKMAGENGITNCKLFLTDNIFKLCTINEFKNMGNRLLNNIKIILCNKPKLITNAKDKQALIEKYHSDPLLGGHCGQKRLLKKLKSNYHWKRMSKDVAVFVKQCHKCQINKVRFRNTEPLCITDTPQKAFDIVSIDTIGPFTRSSNGNAYAVTIQCELTKYIVMLPIPNKEAETVSKAIFEKFVLIYGPMREVRTDLGTEYMNQILSNILQLLSISHKTSTAYHSQTIGGCERNHRVFNEFVRMYINETRDDWDVWSQYYSFCYNTTPSSYHNYTPFELVFGKKVLLPDTFEEMRVDPCYNIDAYDQELRFRLQVAHQRARNYILQQKTKRKIHYDKDATELQILVGNKVLVTNENRNKLDAWYKGPYVVTNIEGVNCTLKAENNKSITVHKNRLKLYNTLMANKT